MATTYAPQLNKDLFESNTDGEWLKSLANVPKITEDVLLRYLVEWVSHIHQSEKAAKKTKSFKVYTFFRDGHVKKNARVQVTHE